MRRRSKSLSDGVPAADAAIAAGKRSLKAYGLVGSRSVGGGLASARVGAATDLFTLVTPPGGASPHAGASPVTSPTATAGSSVLSSRRGSDVSGVGSGDVRDSADGGGGGGGPVHRLLSRKLSGNRRVPAHDGRSTCDA